MLLPQAEVKYLIDYCYTLSVYYMITYNILILFKVFERSFVFDLLHSIFKCKG